MGSAVFTALAAHRFRVALALLAAGLTIAVVVTTTLILIQAMTGAAPDTSGDYGAVY
jgi:hypothetical protein